MKRPLDITAALKAISHPGRLEFLTWLKDPERYFGLTVEEAAGGVPAGRFELRGFTQSTASQHLGILHSAGLLTSRRVGSHVFYRRNEENITQLKLWLEQQI